MISSQRSAQAPTSVIMTRPHYSFPNVETASDNRIQPAWIRPLLRRPRVKKLIVLQQRCET